MAQILETVSKFPIVIQAIILILAVSWSIEMFLLPFNVSRLANRLTEIKKFLERDSADSKAQMDALGGKFDIANLVMSDFWKYKGDLEKMREKDDA